MTKKIKILPLSNYTWEWDRKVYPYYLRIFSEQWRYNKLCPPVYSLFLYKDGEVNCYLDNATLNKSAKKIFNSAVKNPSFQNKWEKFEYKTAEDLHKFCDTAGKINLKKLTNKELIKIYLKGYQVYSKHDSGVGVIRNVNRELQDRLMDLYKKSAIVASLLATNKKSFFAKEHESLVKVANLIKSKKISKARAENLIKNHTKKYFYLPCGYHGSQIYSEDDFQNKIKEIIINKETLANLKRKERNNVVERRNLIKGLKPNVQTKRIISFGSLCTYFKDFIRGNLNRLHYYNTLIFKEISRRTGNNWEDVALLVPQEMKEFVFRKRKIKKARKGIIYSDIKGIHFYFNKNAGSEISRIKKFFNVKDTRLFRGTTASTGKTQGKVLIIKSMKDAVGKKDYVLVSVMTTPDLMPAMKKAKAIITDEGGLTSHAAIISRELGIPCIIGTKIATKVLKDGQLVEVDANKGIVRIIK